MPVWDPDRYLQFADSRTRPFLDLIAQVPGAPASIVDLGCGPGHLTRYLRARWPQARILGIDSSAEMIDEAIRSNSDAVANYDAVDVTTWQPNGPVDLFVSNAMFQWVPNQLEVIARLLQFVAPGGTFAVQVPNNADSPTHVTLAEVAQQEPFAEHLTHTRRLPTTDPGLYLEFFADRGYLVDAWETTYLHVLPGVDPVFDWISGTGARPYLQALPDDLVAPFTDEVKVRLREAYPTHSWGTPLPFRRTFAVATRP
ncbi:methyltransferase domain-containing protein [Gordonia sp. NPDC003950]